MTVTDQLRAAARAEYLLVRTALTSVDKRFVAPLEGRVEGFDNVMARVRSVLGDVDDRLSGHAQPAAAEHAAPTAPAASRPRPAKPTSKPTSESTSEPTSDSEPTAPPEVAAEPVAAAPAEKPEADNASVVLDSEEIEQVEELAHEYLDAEADHLSGELAENEDLREVQARLRAKHTLQERDEQR